MKNSRHGIMTSGLRRALSVCLGLIWCSTCLASSDKSAALAEGIARSFSSERLLTLVAVAAGRAEPDADTQASFKLLRHSLDVDKGVASALLRILDRSKIPAEELIESLATATALYHAVTEDLAGMKLDEPEAQLIVAQAQAAMIAGLFDDAERQLQQLESHEIAASTGEHRLFAARARTLLGKIALMNLEYDEATDDFELARQMIAAAPEATRSATPPLPHLDTDWSLRIAPSQQANSGAPQAGVARNDTTVASEPMMTVMVRPAAATVVAPHGTPRPDSPQIVAAAAKAPLALRAIPADMLKRLLQRGDAMFALGDLTAARLLYERAAEAGEARGATGAGMTYDPGILSQVGARGIQADHAIAATWYRKALDLGDPAAAVRLRRLAQISDQ